MKPENQPNPLSPRVQPVDLVEYAPAEERRARRKIDFISLPFVILCFVMLQYDRTNLGNAQTDNFAKSSGMTTAHINTGQTLFTLGMVLLESPSNMIAKRVGPNRWIPCIMFLWGLITSCQAFIKNKSGFYATRFSSAAGEAGFIPGMAWYLTRFYVSTELSLRSAIFWGSNSIAGMTSGPLALGILRGLSGRNGWHGWQYLFLIEGAMTMFIAVSAFLFLPNSPMDGGRSIVGHVVMTRREAAILTSRASREDPQKAFAKGTAVSMVDIRDTFFDWRLYGHCVSAFPCQHVWPVDRQAAWVLGIHRSTPPPCQRTLADDQNGMQAPASAVGLIVSLTLAWSSDKTRERGVHISIAMISSFAGTSWLALAPDSAGKRVLYGGYLMTAGTMATGQAINASWLSNRFDERRRPIALACYVGSIQLAGFAGSNVFHASDAPRYKHGLIVCGACALAGAAVVLLWKVLYASQDRKSGHVDSADGTAADDLEAKE